MSKVSTICVEISRLEGKNESLEAFVFSLKDAGNKVFVFATNEIVSGETADRFNVRGIEMYDRFHMNGATLPEHDEVLKFEEETADTESDEEKKARIEAEKLAKQIERAKSHGVEVTGTETFEQLEGLIKAAKVAAKKTKKEAKAGK
jgi:pyridoxine 5'-phosphate synthase PdxJ